MHLSLGHLVIFHGAVEVLVFRHKFVEIANNSLGHVTILLGGSLQGNMLNSSSFDSEFGEGGSSIFLRLFNERFKGEILANLFIHLHIIH